MHAENFLAQHIGLHRNTCKKQLTFGLDILCLL